MKLLVGSFLAVLITVALAICSNLNIEKNCQAVVVSAQEIQDSLAQENWLQAQIQLADLQKDWQEETKWWPIVLDHQDMEEIDYLLNRCSKYLQQQNPALAQSSLQELKKRAEHIPEQERPTLQNIF